MKEHFTRNTPATVCHPAAKFPTNVHKPLSIQEHQPSNTKLARLQKACVRQGQTVRATADVQDVAVASNLAGQELAAWSLGLSFKGPLVLPPDLFLLLWGEVVLHTAQMKSHCGRNEGQYQKLRPFTAVGTSLALFYLISHCNLLRESAIPSEEAFG